jgi:hypothetical protein
MSAMKREGFNEHEDEGTCEVKWKSCEQDEMDNKKYRR